MSRLYCKRLQSEFDRSRTVLQAWLPTAMQVQDFRKRELVLRAEVLPLACDDARCANTHSPISANNLHLPLSIDEIAATLPTKLSARSSEPNSSTDGKRVHTWASLLQVLKPHKRLSPLMSANYKPDMAFTRQEAFAPVLAALSTMQSNADRSQKSQAHEYLEKFQKSVGITQYPASLFKTQKTDKR